MSSLYNTVLHIIWIPKHDTQFIHSQNIMHIVYLVHTWIHLRNKIIKDTNLRPLRNEINAYIYRKTILDENVALERPLLHSWYSQCTWLASTVLIKKILLSVQCQHLNFLKGQHFFFFSFHFTYTLKKWFDNWGTTLNCSLTMIYIRRLIQLGWLYTECEAVVSSCLVWQLTCFTSRCQSLYYAKLKACQL